MNNKDGTVSVIEANKEFTIETYNEKYELTGNKSIPFELPVFGGFFSGEKYNYIAFTKRTAKRMITKKSFVLSVMIKVSIE